VKWCLIFILLIELDAQVLESLMVLHSVVAGYTSYYQVNDRRFAIRGDVLMKEKYNRAWHYSQGLELVLSISLGVVSGLKNKNNYLGYVKDLLLFSGVRWIVKDGVYNLLNNDAWFHRSKNTGWDLEMFGTWYVKIGYLVTVIIIYYFF